MAAVAASAFLPFLRNPDRPWTSPATWKSAFTDGAWFAFLVAVVLRHEKDFIRAFSKRKFPHTYEMRMADLAGVVDRTYLDLRSPAKVDAFRTDVLRCIASGIAEQLQLPPETLTANLLVLTDDQPRKMIVRSRSNSLRSSTSEHIADDNFLMWRAIVKGGVEIENDLRRSRPDVSKSYRSIVAIPVTKGECAYGGLSIDSTASYAFHGQRQLVFRQVQPYVALLALTFGPGSPYHECRFYPPHSG